MRTSASTLLCFIAATAVIASSHREAPDITKFPKADNTDAYFFVSPENPSRVVAISCVDPLQTPYGGPNFHLFDDEVNYEMHFDVNHDAVAEFTLGWQFTTFTRDPNTFLYNTGEVTSLDDPELNVYQEYSIHRNGITFVEGLRTAPANVGSASMEDYATLAASAVHDLGFARVFAGPRDDGFFVNLAQIFDLIAVDAGTAFDGVAGTNVSCMAIEVRTDLLLTPESEEILGFWTTTRSRGAQISRLGMPLVNEVVIPRLDKDNFNASTPDADTQFLTYVTDPELEGLLEALLGCPLPPNSGDRQDLVSVFLTGVEGVNLPSAVTASEMLRLNTSIAPLVPGDPGYSPLGVVGGDLSGYPNGRRVHDDVTDISLQAVAGVLVTGTPTGCLDLSDAVQENDVPYLDVFPFLGLPHPGNP